MTRRARTLARFIIGLCAIGAGTWVLHAQGRMPAPALGRSLRYCNPLPIEASSHEQEPHGAVRLRARNPILRKTSGVVTGQAHGSIVQGPDGNWWQFYTIVLRNPPGGRRVGMDPAGFDERGNLFVRGPSETPKWGPGMVRATRRHTPSTTQPALGGTAPLGIIEFTVFGKAVPPSKMPGTNDPE